MQYRKKPVVIEAIKWDGTNLPEVLAFTGENGSYEAMSRGGHALVIRTLEDGPNREAAHVASVGDWIIRGVQGELYPCKPDIFAATYESEHEALKETP